jgi:hypothetical protein
MEENGFTGEFDTLSDKLRVDLRKQYMSGYTPSFLTH